MSRIRASDWTHGCTLSARGRTSFSAGTVSIRRLAAIGSWRGTRIRPWAANRGRVSTHWRRKEPARYRPQRNVLGSVAQQILLLRIAWRRIGANIARAGRSKHAPLLRRGSFFGALFLAG